MSPRVVVLDGPFDPRLQPGMHDAVCVCRCRFGWSGRYRDRPACPGCGRVESPADLAEMDAALRAVAAARRAAGRRPR